MTSAINSDNPTRCYIVVKSPLSPFLDYYFFFILKTAAGKIMAKKRERKKQTNSLVFPLLFTPLETRRGGEVKKKKRFDFFFLEFPSLESVDIFKLPLNFWYFTSCPAIFLRFSFSSFLFSHLMGMNEAVWLLLSAEETNENDNTVVSQV